MLTMTSTLNIDPVTRVTSRVTTSICGRVGSSGRQVQGIVVGTCLIVVGTCLRPARHEGQGMRPGMVNGVRGGSAGQCTATGLSCDVKECRGLGATRGA